MTPFEARITARDSVCTGPRGHTSERFACGSVRHRWAYECGTSCRVVLRAELLILHGVVVLETGRVLRRCRARSTSEKCRRGSWAQDASARRQWSFYRGGAGGHLAGDCGSDAPTYVLLPSGWVSGFGTGDARRSTRSGHELHQRPARRTHDVLSCAMDAATASLQPQHTCYALAVHLLRRCNTCTPAADMGWSVDDAKGQKAREAGRRTRQSFGAEGAAYRRMVRERCCEKSVRGERVVRRNTIVIHGNPLSGFSRWRENGFTRSVASVSCRIWTRVGVVL